MRTKVKAITLLLAAGAGALAISVAPIALLIRRAATPSARTPYVRPPATSSSMIPRHSVRAGISRVRHHGLPHDQRPSLTVAD